MTRQALARVLALAVVAGTAAACSSQTFEAAPTNFAGNYSVNVTPTNDGCQFGWKPDANTVDFTIVQQPNKADMVGTIGGWVGGVLSLAGINSLSGSASASSFVLTTTSKDLVDKQCTYQILAKAEGSMTTKDFITGTLKYTYVKATGVCPGRTVGCESTQSFNGSRPPT